MSNTATGTATKRLPAIDPDALWDASMEAPAVPGVPMAAPTGAARLLDNPKAVVLKSAILAITTLAILPVLFWEHEMATAIYIGALIAVHVVGLIVLLVGVQRGTLMATKRGLAYRIGALVILGFLLGWVAKGVQGTEHGWLFWTSLFGIWAIHTVGVVILHLRGRSAACPFA